MEVICLQHLLIEYLEKHNFLKIAYVNSIFADVKSIIQLSHQHFFADVKQLELKRLGKIPENKIAKKENICFYTFIWAGR